MTTFYTARDYTDQFANLNFIINMKSLKTRERTASGGVRQQPEQAQGEQQQPQETTTAQPQQQAENNNTNTDQRTLSPQPGPSSAAD